MPHHPVTTAPSHARHAPSSGLLNSGKLLSLAPTWLFLHAIQVTSLEMSAVAGTVICLQVLFQGALLAGRLRPWRTSGITLAEDIVPRHSHIRPDSLVPNQDSPKAHPAAELVWG